MQTSAVRALRPAALIQHRLRCWASSAALTDHWRETAAWLSAAVLTHFLDTSGYHDVKSGEAWLSPKWEAGDQSHNQDPLLISSLCPLILLYMYKMMCWSSPSDMNTRWYLSKDIFLLYNHFPKHISPLFVSTLICDLRSCSRNCICLILVKLHPFPYWKLHKQIFKPESDTLIWYGNNGLSDSKNPEHWLTL